ncbi:MAG: hypothetical protein ACJAYX_002851 [Planctomycetota bacterium]
MLSRGADSKRVGSQDANLRIDGDRQEVQRLPYQHARPTALPLAHGPRHVQTTSARRHSQQRRRRHCCYLAVMQPKTQSMLVKAGVLPMPAWLLLVTIAGFFADDYSPIASQASVMTLADGFAHQIVSLAAWISGAALLAFGAGVWTVSGRRFSGGGFCWIIFGIAMIANGIWPMGTPMHGLYAIGIFNMIAPALSLLDVRDDHLQAKLHNLTVFVSIAGVAYLWMMLAGFDPEGYAGLTQRIFGSITFCWPLAFAIQYARTKE